VKVAILEGPCRIRVFLDNGLYYRFSLDLQLPVFEQSGIARGLNR
jgi:hypothetical protein